MNPIDSYLWLEEIQSDASIKWINQQNADSDQYFKTNPYFKNDFEAFKSSYAGENKIPAVRIHQDWIYSLWQDINYKQGLLRRQKLSTFEAGSQTWETVLDLDQLSTSENKKWVLNMYSFCPKSTKGLLYLSDGGSDAASVREFDFATLKFVADGFNLSESKSEIYYLNENEVLVSDATDQQTLTESGYSAQIRYWKRGEDFAKASVVYQIPKSDMTCRCTVDGEMNQAVIIHSYSFTTVQLSYRADSGQFVKINLPSTCSWPWLYKGKLYFKNFKDWDLKGIGFIKSGSLVSLDYGVSEPTSENFKIHFSPEMNTETGFHRTLMQGICFTKDRLCVMVLNDLVTEVWAKPIVDGVVQSKHEILPFSKDCTVGLMASSKESSVTLWNLTSYLKPSTLVSLSKENKITEIKTLKSEFNSEKFVFERLWATSKDGTKIPYDVVRSKNESNQNKNLNPKPAWIAAYGGFEHSLLPSYLGPLGKVWLEDFDGIYVSAHLRGGGEFGPSWHQSAILQNKQKSYDDMAAITEDLIARGLTDPSKTSLHGGSNGGLLVGVMFNQRPDLYKAIVCSVPLIDMQRYHKLLAGHSWTAEYGHPDNPEHWSWIQKYSPYQNLKLMKDHPNLFIYTSTKDDRVHPGHARKYSAKLNELGIKHVYYERATGGHSRSIDVSVAAELSAKFSSFVKSSIHN